MRERWSEGLTVGQGVTVGHWNDRRKTTGCTAIVFPVPLLATLDIRGGAVSVRASGPLGEGRLTQHVDAIVLSGGSGFGLVTADGVMRWLAEHGYGREASTDRIPIVPAAVIFDAGSSLGTTPTAEAGRIACEDKQPLDVVSAAPTNRGGPAWSRRLSW